MSRNRIIDLLAEPPPEPRRNRLSDLMDQPSTADVNAILDQTEVRRGGLVPLVEYASGRVGYGWPEAFRGDLLPEYMFGGRLFNALQEGGPALQEAAGHTAGYGIGATGITAPIPKPSNSLGIFGGRLAKTADHAALARAEEMTAQGLPREQIWNETGWFKGVDGKWRFEIDDSGARLRRRGDTFEPQWRAVADKQDDYPDLQSLLRHGPLAEAYPSVMRRDVKLLPRSSDFDAQYLNGEFSINRDIPREEVRPAMLHEGQHAIQDVEQFSQQGKYQQLTDDEYRRMASEVEARTVEKRLSLTPEQRRARAPWLDYDVPEADQIVRRR